MIQHKAVSFLEIHNKNFSSMWVELKENDVVFFLESRMLDGFGNLNLLYFKVITDTGRIGWIWEKNTKKL